MRIRWGMAPISAFLSRAAFLLIIGLASHAVPSQRGRAPFPRGRVPGRISAFVYSEDDRIYEEQSLRLTGPFVKTESPFGDVVLVPVDRTLDPRVVNALLTRSAPTSLVFRVPKECCPPDRRCFIFRRRDVAVAKRSAASGRRFCGLDHALVALPWEALTRSGTANSRRCGDVHAIVGVDDIGYGVVGESFDLPFVSFRASGSASSFYRLSYVIPTKLADLRVGRRIVVDRDGWWIPGVIVTAASRSVTAPTRGRLLEDPKLSIKLDPDGLNYVHKVYNLTQIRLFEPLRPELRCSSRRLNDAIVAARFPSLSPAQASIPRRDRNSTFSRKNQILSGINRNESWVAQSDGEILDKPRLIGLSDPGLGGRGSHRGHFSTTKANHERIVGGRVDRRDGKRGQGGSLGNAQSGDTNHRVTVILLSCAAVAVALTILVGTGVNQLRHQRHSFDSKKAADVENEDASGEFVFNPQAAGETLYDSKARRIPGDDDEQRSKLKKLDRLKSPKISWTNSSSYLRVDSGFGTGEPHARAYPDLLPDYASIRDYDNHAEANKSSAETSQQRPSGEDEDAQEDDYAEVYDRVSPPPSSSSSSFSSAAMHPPNLKHHSLQKNSPEIADRVCDPSTQSPSSHSYETQQEGRLRRDQLQRQPHRRKQQPLLSPKNFIAGPHFRFSTKSFKSHRESDVDFDNLFSLSRQGDSHAPCYCGKSLNRSQTLPHREQHLTVNAVVKVTGD